MRMRIVGDDGLLLLLSLSSLVLSFLVTFGGLCVLWDAVKTKILGKKLGELVHSISVIGSPSIPPSPISQNSYYITQ